jgi:spore germination cell wall hydrolase CwlJ-like protein|tara:strand:+ start:4212 stop:4670 length:459 start_codon:yes stop_codon:yes gene_type:complete
MKTNAVTIITLLLFALALNGGEKNLTDQQVVALTILGEARGEGQEGMYGVACVISQRSLHWKRNWRKQTPRQVCLVDKQFECWNNGRIPNGDLLNTQEGKYALYLAMNITRVDRSYVNYADHYCHINKNNYWTKGHKPVAIIKKHKFFKLRP